MIIVAIGSYSMIPITPIFWSLDHWWQLKRIRRSQVLRGFTNVSTLLYNDLLLSIQERLRFKRFSKEILLFVNWASNVFDLMRIPNLIIVDLGDRGRDN